MPFAESMISALKSNKAIMLDKSRRFRKTKGSYDWSKNTLRNLPKATEQELIEISKQIKKENKRSRIKQGLLFLTIFFIVLLTFLMLLK